MHVFTEFTVAPGYLSVPRDHCPPAHQPCLYRDLAGSGERRLRAKLCRAVDLYRASGAFTGTAAGGAGLGGLSLEIPGQRVGLVSVRRSSPLSRRAAAAHGDSDRRYRFGCDSAAGRAVYQYS